MGWVFSILELFTKLIDSNKFDYNDPDSQKLHDEHPTLNARNHALVEMSWQGTEAERRAEYAKLIERHPDLRQELEDYAIKYPINFIPPDNRPLSEKPGYADDWVRWHFAQIEHNYLSQQVPWAKGSPQREKDLSNYREWLDNWKETVEIVLKAHHSGHDTNSGEKLTDKELVTLIEDKFREAHGYRQEIVQERIVFTQEMRQIVLSKNAGRCYICGEPIWQGDYEIDHINPLSKGGTNHISNLMPAHKSCNRIKGTKSISEL